MQTNVFFWRERMQIRLLNFGSPRFMRLRPKKGSFYIAYFRVLMHILHILSFYKYSAYFGSLTAFCEKIIVKSRNITKCKYFLA